MSRKAGGENMGGPRAGIRYARIVVPTAGLPRVEPTGRLTADPLPQERTAGGSPIMDIVVIAIIVVLLLVFSLLYYLSEQQRARHDEQDKRLARGVCPVCGSDQIEKRYKTREREHRVETSEAEDNAGIPPKEKVVTYREREAWFCRRCARIVYEHRWRKLHTPPPDHRPDASA